METVEQGWALHSGLRASKSAGWQHPPPPPGLPALPALLALHTRALKRPRGCATLRSKRPCCSPLPCVLLLPAAPLAAAFTASRSTSALFARFACHIFCRPDRPPLTSTAPPRAVLSTLALPIRACCRSKPLFATPKLSYFVSAATHLAARPDRRCLARPACRRLQPCLSCVQGPRRIPLLCHGVGTGSAGAPSAAQRCTRCTRHSCLPPLQLLTTRRCL